MRDLVMPLEYFTKEKLFRRLRNNHFTAFSDFVSSFTAFACFLYVVCVNTVKIKIYIYFNSEYFNLMFLIF